MTRCSGFVLIGTCVVALTHACSASVGDPVGAGGVSSGSGASPNTGSVPDGTGAIPGVGGTGPNVGGVGASPTGGGGNSGVPPISCDISALLSTCNGSICHSSSQREGDLILDQVDPLGPEMAQELIGTYASYSGVQDAWNCPEPRAEVRVDPTNIDASQVLTKLIGPPSCGALMPDTAPAETASPWLPENRAASIQCIREWLLNLVANNP